MYWIGRSRPFQIRCSLKNPFRDSLCWAGSTASYTGPQAEAKARDELAQVRSIAQPLLGGVLLAGFWEQPASLDELRTGIRTQRTVARCESPCQRLDSRVQNQARCRRGLDIPLEETDV